MRWALFGLLIQASGAMAVESADLSDWQAVSETGAGQIYHRNVEYSSVPMVMISTTLAADPARVHALVTDYGQFAGFIPNVAQSRVLAHEGDRQWVFHHLHFAGPVADRSYIMRSTDTRRPHAQHYRVDWQLAERQFAGVGLSPGLTPKAFSGFWDIRPAARAGFSEARYAVHSDPGGLIPAWLVARMTDRYVQQVVEAVRRRLADK